MENWVLEKWILWEVKDAFDCDFCGVNSDLNLEDIGGDGLDISGSNINAVISKANNVKDMEVSIEKKVLQNYQLMQLWIPICSGY